MDGKRVYRDLNRSPLPRVGYIHHRDHPEGMTCPDSSLQRVWRFCFLLCIPKEMAFQSTRLWKRMKYSRGYWRSLSTQKTAKCAKSFSLAQWTFHSSDSALIKN